MADYASYHSSRQQVRIFLYGKPENKVEHDDVIKWKIFRVTGPLCGEFTGPRWIPLTTRAVTRNFDVFFDLCPNKRLSKQWWGWWFETQSRSLWRHCIGFSLVHMCRFWGLMVFFCTTAIWKLVISQCYWCIKHYRFDMLQSRKAQFRCNMINYKGKTLVTFKTNPKLQYWRECNGRTRGYASPLMSYSHSIVPNWNASWLLSILLTFAIVLKPHNICHSFVYIHTPRIIS